MEGLFAPLQQWFLFSGVLLLVGCVAWRIVVASGAASALGPSSAGSLAAVESRVSTTALIVTLLLLPVWGLRMGVQLIGFRDPFVPLSEDLSFLVRDTFWGTVWLAQGAVILLLVGAFWVTRVAVRSQSDQGAAKGFPSAGIGWWIAGLLVALLTFTLALSSHAMGVTEYRNLAVAADGLHTLTGGAWIGALALILAFGRGAGMDGGSRLLAAQLRSFSPMAIAAVAVLVTMGVYLSWTHLSTPSDLWASSYGRVLSLKVLAAGVVFILGFLNWRVGLPSMDAPGGDRKVRRQATLEVVVALAVLLLTAVLTQTPKPGEFG
jgi:copper resistance protein D